MSSGFRMGGANEVAELLGVSRQRVAKLRERPDFPEPIGAVSGRSIWDLDAIQAWGGSESRGTPGRPTDESRRRVIGGRFVLEDRIGTGGFADVYRATDRKQTDPAAMAVAVKVLHNLELDAIRRRERELRVLAEISHPNVMSILGRGETDEEGYFYAMPLARGSLVEFADEFRGRENQGQLLELMRQVCAGLEHVHGEGVFHRDLKPGNILRFEAAEPMATVSDRWVLADFGLAVEVERQTTTLTGTGAMLGTPWYMAPEQWGHARDVDERADIYSLGRIVQELHTGERAQTVPPGDLRRVILRATNQNPEDRHQTVPEFLADLERALTPLDVSKWETPEEAAERWVQRLRFQNAASNELDEFLDWALGLDSQDDDEARALTQALPALDERAINDLWSRRRAEFRDLFKAHSRRVREVGFPFNYCDVLADFARRASRVTRDDEVLRYTISSLCELGEYHNRWFVRGVVTGILQTLREPDEIFAAINGLTEANRSAVVWTMNDFSVRSLAPELRAALAELGIESD